MPFVRSAPSSMGAWWRSVLAVVVCAGTLSVVGVAASSASAQGATSHAVELKWVKSSALVSGQGGVNAVSCASANFCVAVDRSGDASVFNGTTWGAPQRVDGLNAFSSISCPSATFCVATDNSGNFVEMNNGVWGSRTPFASVNSPTMQAVSCASVSFCLAVGRTAAFSPSDYYFYNGAWYADSVAFSSTDTNSLTAVSCTLSLVCLATDQAGGVMSFSFTSSPTPSLSHSPSPTPIDPGAKNFIALSIACVTATSCVVGSGSNQISTLSGATWTTTTVFPAQTTGVVVSCAQSTCVASNSQGDGVSSTAPFATWSPGGALEMLAQINALSCYPVAASVGCQAVDNDGFSITLALGTGGVPTFTPAAAYFDPLHTLTSVSCASATYCIAGDAAGETVTYRAGRWTVPKVVTTMPLGVREVRCGLSAHPYRALQCAAVAGNFEALHLASYTSAWTPAPLTNTQTYAISCSNACEYLSPEGRSSGLVGGYIPKLPTSAIVTDVSCPAAGRDCVAIDSSGHSYVSASGRWVAGARVESIPSRVLWSLSCASTTFCAAIDLSGHAYVFNGAKWSAASKVSALGLYAVSCATTYFCVATDLLGGAYVYNGATWVATAHASGFGALHGVSCASATNCVAVDSTHAYDLVIPTDKTSIAFAPSRGERNVVGRTVVMVSVSAAAAPAGRVTLSAGLSPAAPSCTATLRKVSATRSRAHCTIATRSLGPTYIDASFAGSFGFAPAGPTRHLETVIKK